MVSFNHLGRRNTYEKEVGRDRVYYRHVRECAIKRKKKIANRKYGYDWYKYDGQYSKGKIHCGCGLCKFGKKYGLPTVRDERERSREKVLKKEYSGYNEFESYS